MRPRGALAGGLGLAATGVGLAAGVLAATVPLSFRYEVPDILLRLEEYESESSPSGLPAALATLIVESCGGEEGGLLVIPDGRSVVVTGTLLQQREVRQVLANLRKDD